MLLSSFKLWCASGFYFGPVVVLTTPASFG
ncbi:hypothetical protein H4Q32_024697 [Labeo rohita]|uniref:Uncharacterized protein n=1 Tax=Labeo rohita TaxID=84645 RepID=A0ABQ8L576_LABRO|nr:hypothetical protein H4Q32_024697 [Labeo rohita]